MGLKACLQPNGGDQAMGFLRGACSEFEPCSIHNISSLGLTRLRVLKRGFVDFFHIFIRAGMCGRQCRPAVMVPPQCGIR